MSCSFAGAHYRNRYGSVHHSRKHAVQIQLLIEGLLGFSVMFFQIVCYTSARQLHKSVGRASNIAVQINELLAAVRKQGGGAWAIKSRLQGLSPSSALDKGAFILGTEEAPASAGSGGGTRSGGLAQFGSRRFSPWAGAAWIQEIDQMALEPIERSKHRPGGAWFRRRYHPTAQRQHQHEHVELDEEFVEVAMRYYRKWLQRRNELPLHLADRVLIAWGLIVGAVYIYVKGTYVLFSSWVGDNSSPSWILVFWKLIGRMDQRYVKSDDFLVSTEGFLALIVGPLALTYAWSVYSSSKYRHVCGIICSSSDLYTLLMTLAIEIRTKFRDFDTGHIPMFVLLFVVLNLIRALTSVHVLITECRQVVQKTDRHATKHGSHVSFVSDESGSIERVV